MGCRTVVLAHGKTGTSRGHLRLLVSSTSDVPSAAQLKALLKLKDSFPDEFQRLVKSATGASLERETSEATTDEDLASEQSSSTSASDGSMDASSVGDSTVCQLDDQLERTGTEGSVRAATGKIPTTTLSKWQHSRKRTRKSSVSSMPVGNSVSNKKSRVDNNLVVFLKGVNFDIAKVASKVNSQ